MYVLTTFTMNVYSAKADRSLNITLWYIYTFASITILALSNQCRVNELTLLPAAESANLQTKRPNTPPRASSIITERRRTESNALGLCISIMAKRWKQVVCFLHGQPLCTKPVCGALDLSLDCLYYTSVMFFRDLVDCGITRIIFRDIKWLATSITIAEPSDFPYLVWGHKYAWSTWSHSLHMDDCFNFVL